MSMSSTNRVNGFSSKKSTVLVHWSAEQPHEAPENVTEFMSHNGYYVKCDREEEVLALGGCFI